MCIRDRYKCAKNYQNSPWFDDVIAKIKWCSFFDSHGSSGCIETWLYRDNANMGMSYRRRRCVSLCRVEESTVPVSCRRLCAVCLEMFCYADVFNVLGIMSQDGRSTRLASGLIRLNARGVLLYCHSAGVL